jgi:hypothetical protein
MRAIEGLRRSFFALKHALKVGTLQIASARAAQVFPIVVELASHEPAKPVLRSSGLVTELF